MPMNTALSVQVFSGRLRVIFIIAHLSLSFGLRASGCSLLSNFNFHDAANWTATVAKSLHFIKLFITK